MFGHIHVSSFYANSKTKTPQQYLYLDKLSIICLYF